MPVALVGPTAIGKSAVAAELCRRVGGEIISVDSRQVFRHIPIATNVATAADLGGVRSHLTEVLEPEERVDAASFISMASPVVRDLAERGRAAVLTAGTGMYLEALLRGRDLGGHAADPKLRAELEAAAEGDLGALFRRLQDVDPAVAAATDPRNPVRVVRRLELALLRGRGDAPTLATTPPIAALKVGLDCDRSALHTRISARIDVMLENGLREEVECLLDEHRPSAQVLAGIGVAEMVAHLRHGAELGRCVARMAQRTRAYARRQITWFRADAGTRWIDTGGRSASDIVDSVLDILETT